MTLGLYVSVYAYSILSVSKRLAYESAIIDRIYLDFDSKVNPALAIHEANKVMEALHDRGIESVLYFSGEKGIACYIDFPPTDIASENKKDVLCLFWNIINEGLDLELHTLDGGSVRGDIARVSRLPNTRHQSGLYCIPLERSDLIRGAGYIRRLALMPRADFDLEATIKENTKSNRSTVPRLLKTLENIVIERRKEAEEIEKMKQNRMHIKIHNSSGFVTEEQIQKAKSFPIAKILGNKKLMLCPFHKDTNPSLSIDHKKGLWHCFGCGRSGNVIQLVMGMEGMGFQEAVRKLVCI